MVAIWAMQDKGGVASGRPTWPVIAFCLPAELFGLAHTAHAFFFFLTPACLLFFVTIKLSVCLCQLLTMRNENDTRTKKNSDKLFTKTDLEKCDQLIIRKKTYR